MATSPNIPRTLTGLVIAPLALKHLTKATHSQGINLRDSRFVRQAGTYGIKDNDRDRSEILRIKADSTLGASQAVPHPSTGRALCRLTLEVARDPVHSTLYGRRRKNYSR